MCKHEWRFLIKPIDDEIDFLLCGYEICRYVIFDKYVDLHIRICRCCKKEQVLIP